MAPKMFTIWMVLVCFIVPNQTKHSMQGKSYGCKYHNDCLTLALVVNTPCSDNLKTYDNFQISMSEMLWKVVASILYVVVCKPIGMDDIICI